jgi:predicted N-formylglutamate amidohydrolase
MALSGGDYLILSCEHGGNRLPARFRSLFSSRFLDTHRGYDPGALELARDFARATRAPLFYSTLSRLLVELNRPLGHAQVFSKTVPTAARPELLKRYYVPYWQEIERAIRRSKRRVLHVSFHSFTPKLRDERRTTDVGLLFDPARAPEVAFCRRWRDAILESAPRFHVRYNDPYDGTHPSVVASMREKFPARRYVGIQIEVNQKFPRGDTRPWRALRRLLTETFHVARADPSLL